MLSFFRVESTKKNRSVLLALESDQLSRLGRLGVPVILTTDVYTNLDTQKDVMVGGDVLKYVSRQILHLIKLKKHIKVDVIKPFKKSVVFRIGKNNIEI